MRKRKWPASLRTAGRYNRWLCRGMGTPAALQHRHAAIGQAAAELRAVQFNNPHVAACVGYYQQ